VARHILATFYAKKEGKPLPPPPTPQDMQFDFSDPYGPGHMPGAEPDTEEPVNDTH
jgi:hypothetical protein